MIVDKLQLFSYIVPDFQRTLTQNIQCKSNPEHEFLLAHKYNAILIMDFTLLWFGLFKQRKIHMNSK